MRERADVVIVGGGPVGAALALALSGSGLDVRLLEARSAGEPPRDPRPLALSYGSRLILERLGAWEPLAGATPIDRIHVSQRGGFGRVALSALEAGLPALGYVVDYGRLHAVLQDALTDTPGYVTGCEVTATAASAIEAVVEFTAGGIAGNSLPTRLVVLADGGAIRPATVETVDYHQTALATRVRSELPHAGTAFERFTARGPLALLPAGDELALIWTTDHAAAEALQRCGPAEFLANLRREFGGRLGDFTSVAARTLFPLVMQRADTTVSPRTVLVGNAAQTLHPVAGQGFNLGLRDAWELAEEIRRDERDAIGSAPALSAYRARRRLDRRGGIWFTDALVRLFSNDILPLRVARGAGLAFLGCVPPAKDFIIRRMTFGARG